MNREQLLKKMLAVKAYLDRQKEVSGAGSEKKSSGDDVNGTKENKGKKQGEKANRVQNRNWTKEWEEEIKKDLDGQRRSDIRKVSNQQMDGWVPLKMTFFVLNIAWIRRKKSSRSGTSTRMLS